TDPLSAGSYPFGGGAGTGGGGTNFSADVDVDSDNNNGLGAPDRSAYEDSIETNEPGKVVFISHGDGDGDGIPDYADGYNLLGSASTADNIATNVHFVPIVFEIGPDFNLAQTMITLSYSASPPLEVSTNGGTYTPASGEIRIWTKPGNTMRSGQPTTSGGSWLAPGTYTAYDFGFRGTRTITCWIEGVNPGCWVSMAAQAYQGGGSDIVEVCGLKLDLDIWNGGCDLDNGEAAGPQGDAVPDADEETVGAYLLVNWDDDDKDGEINSDGSAWCCLPKPDLEQNSVTDEDNLAKLKPTVEQLLDTGTIELELSGADAGRVKLWTQSNKVTQVMLTSNKKTWNLANSTEKADFQSFTNAGYWIEGTDEGTAEKGVIFTLRYKAPGGTEVCSDTTKATVVMINLGNGSYRELGLDVGKARGHAALVCKYIGKCNKTDLSNDDKFLLIEMGGPTDTKTLTTMTGASGLTCFGCYGKPGITYQQRLRVILTAKGLVQRAASIGYDPLSVVRPEGWEDTLDLITALRCDGLVEVCYEWNSLSLWGKIVNMAIHYSVLTDSYQAEHDILDVIWWKDRLWPATQCGREATYKGTKWDTTFTKQDLCKPIGTKGGN
ncbi:MAG: hypothetical protein WCL44_13680, partial [bacterium]